MIQQTLKFIVRFKTYIHGKINYFIEIGARTLNTISALKILDF